MNLQKTWKSGSRPVALALVSVMVMALTSGCGSSQNVANNSKTTGNSGQGLHKLTQEDIVQIYKPGTEAVFQDSSMKEGVKASGMKEVELTAEEKQKIKDMHLNIAIQLDHLDDAMKWVIAGIQKTSGEMGITLKDTWIGTAQNNVSQLDDYQRIEAIAKNYDAIFTNPSDASTSSDVLKAIMKKTKMGFICSAPYSVDWNDPNFIGVSDIDAYQAGLYSAEAAVKMLNGKGTIGTIGFINGKQGAIQTCYQRYKGWDKVLKDNPDVKVVQKWFDDPAQSKAVVSSLLASNPDIKVLLVDWANPPADQAQQVLKERGLKPWKDISLVTIDMDNTITVPMAMNGPDNNYAGAFISQTWYTAGQNAVKQYAKKLLYGNQAPKYVVSPPLPVTTWNNLKTDFTKVAPEGFKIPDEVMNLKDQWPLGVEDQWK